MPVGQFPVGQPHPNRFAATPSRSIIQIYWSRFDRTCLSQMLPWTLRAGRAGGQLACHPATSASKKKPAVSRRDSGPIEWTGSSLLVVDAVIGTFEGGVAVLGPGDDLGLGAGNAVVMPNIARDLELDGATGLLLNDDCTSSYLWSRNHIANPDLDQIAAAKLDRTGLGPGCVAPDQGGSELPRSAFG